jgi:hypothetical protein
MSICPSSKICSREPKIGTQKSEFARGVWPCHLHLTVYIKAKEESWKFKYFTMQKYNLQKNPLKETKILQDIITL